MKRYRVIQNAARCRKCGDTIVSHHRHDWVPCTCGAIFVDGGREYIRQGGSAEDLEDLSKVKEIDS